MGRRMESPLLPESQSFGFNVKPQIRRAELRGKGNKIYSSSDKEEDSGNKPLKALSSHF
jgi:hypothetical protein